MEKIADLYNTPIRAYVNNLTFQAEKVVRLNISEDTFDLQKDTKRELAVREGDSFVGYIFTDSTGPSAPYAETVHFGGSTVKNYYKSGGRENGGTPFLTTSDGTQFMTKGRRFLEDNF